MFSKILAPVTIAAAALALTACSPLDIITPASTSAPVTATTNTPAPEIAKVATPTEAPTAAPAPAPARCEEDQPCWDCATMGNKICGPAAPLDTITAPDTTPAAAPVAPVYTAPAPSYAPVASKPVAAPAPAQYTPSNTTAQTVPQNQSALKPGDAWAGVGTYYSTPTAAAPAPAPAATTAPVPAANRYSGNPVVNCAALGKLTAEDGTCVAPTYYTPAPTAPVKAAPAPTTSAATTYCIHTDELRPDGSTGPSMCR